MLRFYFASTLCGNSVMSRRRSRRLCTARFEKRMHCCLRVAAELVANINPSTQKPAVFRGDWRVFEGTMRNGICCPLLMSAWQVFVGHLLLTVNERIPNKGCLFLIGYKSEVIGDWKLKDV